MTEERKCATCAEHMVRCVEDKFGCGQGLPLWRPKSKVPSIVPNKSLNDSCNALLEHVKKEHGDTMTELTVCVFHEDKLGKLYTSATDDIYRSVGLLEALKATLLKDAEV